MREKKFHSINPLFTEQTYKQIKDGSDLLGCCISEFLEIAVHNFYLSDKIMEMARVHLSELELLINHACVSRLDSPPEISKPKHGGKVLTAYGVLREQLSDGEWHSKKRLVGEVMEEVDVSDATLQRIANELGVQTRRTSSTPSTTEWRVSDSELPI